MKIDEFENCKFDFLEKQADLKQIVPGCDVLLMITYNMLTQKYYFCKMI